jgi:hypothetical protein
VAAAGALVLAAFAAGARGTAAGDEKDAAAAARELVGAWEYAEDRTPPEHKRDPRERGPLGATFKVSLVENAIVVEQTMRGAIRASRVALDGSEDVKQEGASTRTTSGRLVDGVLTMREVTSSERSGTVSTHSVEHTLTPGKDGLLVRRVIAGTPPIDRSALYRRASDVPAPKAAKGDIAQLAWLEGRFVAATGGAKPTRMEEHWGPPGGGAMLGTARTVTSEKMTSFEFLRIVERDGGLVYIAQPGGGPAVEFVLTELSATRALFENPRHDFPKRIVYEHLPADQGRRDGLRTEISDTGGSRAISSSYERAR